MARAAVGLGGRVVETSKGAGQLGAEAVRIIGNVMGGEEGKAVELSAVVGQAGEEAGAADRVGGDLGGEGQKVSLRGLAGLAGCRVWGEGRANSIGEAGWGAGRASEERVEVAYVSREVYS